MSIKTETWVGWIAGFSLAMVTVVFVAITYAYANFETKEHAKDVADRVTRLDQKFDEVFGIPKNWKPKDGR